MNNRLYDIAAYLYEPMELKSEINAMISDYDTNKESSLSLNEVMLHFSSMEQQYKYAMVLLKPDLPMETIFQLGRLSYKIDMERDDIKKKTKYKDAVHAIQYSDNVFTALGVLYKHQKHFISYIDLIKFFSDVSSTDIKVMIKSLIDHDLMNVKHKKDGTYEYQISAFGIETYRSYIKTKGGKIEYVTRMVRRRNQGTNQENS